MGFMEWFYSDSRVGSESLQLRNELPTLLLLIWVGGSGLGEQVRG